MKIIFSSKEM